VAREAAQGIKLQRVGRVGALQDYDAPERTELAQTVASVVTFPLDVREGLVQVRADRRAVSPAFDWADLRVALAAAMEISLAARSMT